MNGDSHSGGPGARKRGQRPGIGRVVLDDLRQTRLHRDYWGEIREIYRFYLDDEARTRLAGMSRVGRAFSLLGWLLKSLLLKLSPARRVLVVISLTVMVLGQNTFRFGDTPYQVDLHVWGFTFLLLVVMLELKDKLVAKDEIAIARQVQLALLPREHPTIPGWSVWSFSRPANTVGGDLVDYLEIDGFRHGIVLGDVAGKGLGAALLGAKLQATLRALLPDAASLDDLGTRVNTILYRDGLDNRYATLFCAVLEHDSNQVHYLNAGHNPAIVFRADGHETLDPSSFPLGMLPVANYAECETRLQSGDLLLVYSDGLTEAIDDHGEEFGVERLVRLVSEAGGLSPELLGERILAGVDRFLGDTRAHDDLSIVVVARD